MRIKTTPISLFKKRNTFHLSYSIEKGYIIVTLFPNNYFNEK